MSRQKKACEHVLLNVKKAIDLAPNKGTFYIDVPRNPPRADEDPAPPHIDGAGDLVIPTYFCRTCDLIDELKGLKCFEGLYMSLISSARYIKVAVES